MVAAALLCARLAMVLMGLSLAGRVALVLALLGPVLVPALRLRLLFELAPAPAWLLGPRALAPAWLLGLRALAPAWLRLGPMALFLPPPVPRRPFLF